jgi:hypothetical protein
MARQAAVKCHSQLQTETFFSQPLRIATAMHGIGDVAAQGEPLNPGCSRRKRRKVSVKAGGVGEPMVCQAAVQQKIKAKKTGLAGRSKHYLIDL